MKNWYIIGRKIYAYIYIYIYIYVCMCVYTYIYILPIGLVVRVFTNGPGDLGSILCRVMQKMILDVSLLNTEHYKGKVEQSRKKNWHSLLHLGVIAI